MSQLLKGYCRFACFYTVFSSDAAAPDMAAPGSGHAQPYLSIKTGQTHGGFPYVCPFIAVILNAGEFHLKF